MKYLFICALSFVSLISLVGCENAFSKMEGAELRARAYRCVIAVDQTAAELQVCKNIQRECQRRQDAGRFDC